MGTSDSSSAILFDHNADGLKTGTGWLQSDDAWLVLDRNGNGSIDSGRELFGVDTLITTVIQPSSTNGLLEPTPYTRNATSGFEALRTLDANGDGWFNASDAAFTQVRLWQDFNQDGTSQAGELATLAAKGITGISLQETHLNQDLGNGNSITASAVVTRSNGSSTQVEAVGLAAANLALADNPFYRSFPDQVPLTEQARNLPDMGGSGVVRDLREAMSLSPELTALVQQFAAATTRDAQLAMMVPLLEAWRVSVAADPSLGGESKAIASIQRNWSIGEPAAGPSSQYNLQFTSTGTPDQAAFLKSLSNRLGDTAPSAEAGLERMLGVLQAFNGQAMWHLEQPPGVVLSSLRLASGEWFHGLVAGAGGSGQQAASDDFSVLFPFAFGAPAMQSLMGSYSALQESVYASLAMQTRLRPYLDAVDLLIDEAGMHFDTTAMANLLQATYAADPREGMDDLAELLRYGHGTLDALDFNGMGMLNAWVQALPADSPLRDHLRNDLGVVLAPGQGNASQRNDVMFGDASVNGMFGGQGDDVLHAGAGNDALHGDTGSDLLFGGEGNDQLSGDEGNDILWGNAGNDTLQGGNGADIYRFEAGFGQDMVDNFNSDATNSQPDTLRLSTNTHAGNVLLSRGAGASLVIKVAGTPDQVTINNYLHQDGTSPWAVSALQLGDGTVWDVATVMQRLLQNTPGADVLQGYGLDDSIGGGDGDDTLYGYGGHDTLRGDAGSDRLLGETGNDLLDGGLGADQLFGDAGHDTLVGGAGDDQLTGGTGADTYRFAAGWGRDFVDNLDSDAAGTAPDVLEFDTGIAPADLAVQRSLDNLLLVRTGGADTVTVNRFFASDGATPSVVEEVRFADGTVWTTADIKRRALLGGAGNDTLTGYASDDNLAGNTGDDLLYGRAGTDTLAGGAGADRLYGEDGADTLRGDDDIDTLDGGAGNDLLFGGAGNDSLQGGAGQDSLTGDAGQDSLQGGDGADTYHFGSGAGQDTVANFDADAQGSNADTVQLGSGLTPANVQLRRLGDSLVLTVQGNSADKLTMANYFVADGASAHAVEALRFADGTVWGVASVKQRVLVPTAGADQLTGYAGNDGLGGGADNDTLQGRAGNDTLDGGSENDTLDGGDGDDTLLGGTGTDALTGGNGHDSLDGGAQADTLAGGAGNDTLAGGAGHDTLQGNGGADTYRFERGGGRDTVNNVDTDGLGLQPDQVLFGAGIAPADVVATRSGSDLWLSLRGTDDKVVVQNHFVGDGVSGFSIDSVRFADGSTWSAAQLKTLVMQATDDNDVIVGYATADVLAGGAGDDNLSGQAGADPLDGGAGDDVLAGGAGNDTLSGGTGRDNLDGGADTDTLFGGDQGDTLTGGDGADTLDGGAGNDSLAGGNGADVYRFARGSGQDDIANRDTDAVGTAADTVVFGAGITAADITVTRSADDLVLLLNGADDRLKVLRYFSLDGTTSETVDHLQFADGTVWSYAAVKARVVAPPTPAATTVAGTADADTLVGAASSDFINAGTGADTVLFGRGSGRDTVSWSDAVPTEVDRVVLGAGINPADVGLRRGVGDALVLSLAGSMDTLTVASHFNADATGGSQVDSIVFADGTTWSQAAIKAQVIAATAGFDEIIGYAPPDNLAGGDGDDSLFGRAGDDVLDGGAGKDTLRGEDGNDTLHGGAQADWLEGGTGADRLHGGAGADTLLGDAGDDWLDGGAGDDTLDGSAGNDTYLLARGGGKDRLAIYDTATGRVETVRVADGLLPADLLARRDNNDLLLSIKGTGDSIRVANHFQSDATGPNRLDRVQFGDGTQWSLAQINAMALLGTSDVDLLRGLSGNDSINGLDADDQLWGDAGNDTLNGGAGHDRLYGEAGDDWLNGGTGADLLAGGAGNDFYVVDHLADVVSEALNQGTDTVSAGLDWVLPDHVENLRLAGLALSGAGNALANTLTGNALANTLAGGAGNDMLIGGAGGDTYRFERGWGVDTVRENDTAAGVVDAVSFGAGIAATDLAWQRTGNHLQATLNAGSDKLVLENWFLGAAYQAEQFRFADGAVLTAAQVQGVATALLSTSAPTGAARAEPGATLDAGTQRQWLGLLSAMAAFAPEAGAELTRSERIGPWRVPELAASLMV